MEITDAPKQTRLSKSPNYDEGLFLANQGLDAVPASLLSKTRFDCTRFINLSQNKLDCIPAAFYSGFPNLIQLNLQHNLLSKIDGEIGRMKELEELRVDHNALTRIPPAICALPRLATLSVSHNEILELPDDIRELRSSLRLLNVSDNKIKELPEGLAELSNLTKLSIAQNLFVAIPSAIYQLEQLEELDLEWLQYTVPPHPVALRGLFLKNVLASIRIPLQKMYDSGAKQCTFVAFLRHLSAHPFQLNGDATVLKRARMRTPLHTAAHEGHLGVLLGLIEAEADLDIVDSDGHSALSLAILAEKFEAAQLLVRRGASINMGGGHFGTALHLACVLLNNRLVRTLLKGGADVNALDAEGNSPLFALIKAFDKDIPRISAMAEAVLASGVWLNARNHSGWGLVHFAAKKDTPNAMLWMARQNELRGPGGQELFDFSLPGGEDSWTPLHIAAYNGNLAIIQVLLSQGADVFARNADGRRPAQVSRRVKAVKKLLIREENRRYRALLVAKVPLPALDLNTPQNRMCVVRVEKCPASACEAESDFENAIRCTLAEDTAANTCKSASVNCSFAIASANIRNPSETTKALSAKRQLRTVLLSPKKYNVINLGGMKNTLLNNNARMHLRYKALWTLRKYWSKVPACRVFSEILDNINRVNSLALRLDISACIGEVQLLSDLIDYSAHHCENNRVYAEISATIANLQANVFSVLSNTIPNERTGTSRVKRFVQHSHGGKGRGSGELVPRKRVTSGFNKSRLCL